MRRFFSGAIAMVLTVAGLTAMNAATPAARHPSRRGPRRSDPRRDEHGNPFSSYLTRDPARRGPQRVRRARHLRGHAGGARCARRRGRRRDAAVRRAGDDVRRLGSTRAATSSPCGPTPSSRRLLGITGAPGTLADAYLQVEHRLRRRVRASPTRRSSSTAPPTATRSPARPRRDAVLRRDDGDRESGGDVAQRRQNGGQAAAFTYDLARSVVYTRQGNPAWAGQERDGDRPDPVRTTCSSATPLATRSRIGSTSTRSRSRRPTSSSGCSRT